MLSEISRDRPTLSYSRISASDIVGRCLWAKVDNSRSVSRMPRLRDWYSSRARVTSAVSWDRSIGCGSIESIGGSEESLVEEYARRKNGVLCRMHNAEKGGERFVREASRGILDTKEAISAFLGVMKEKLLS